MTSSLLERPATQEIWTNNPYYLQYQSNNLGVTTSHPYQRNWLVHTLPENYTGFKTYQLAPTESGFYDVLASAESANPVRSDKQFINSLRIQVLEHVTNALKEESDKVTRFATEDFQLIMQIGKSLFDSSNHQGMGWFGSTYGPGINNLSIKKLINPRPMLSFFQVMTDSVIDNWFEEGEEELDPFSEYTQVITWIKEHTGLSNIRVGKLFGATRQSIYNWEKGKVQGIEDGTKQKILIVKDILERASRKHATPEALKAWLDTPRGVEGKTPAIMFQEGLFDQARFYANSKQPLNMKRPKYSSDRKLPDEWVDAREIRQQPIPLSELASYSDDGE